MSDIVERLRQNAGTSGEWGELADRLQIEAADEIERLHAIVVAAEQNALQNSQKLVVAHEELERLRAEVDRRFGIGGELIAARKELAELRTELSAALATIEYAAHQLEKARIWGGMDWHYNPLHPLHYRSALERLRDVLRRKHSERVQNEPAGE